MAKQENNNYSKVEGAKTAPIPMPLPPNTEERERRVLDFLYTYIDASREKVIESLDPSIFRSAEGAYIVNAFKEYKGLEGFTALAEKLANLVNEADPSRGTYMDWLNRPKEAYRYGREYEEMQGDLSVMAREVRNYEAALQAAELYHLTRNGQMTVEAIEEAEKALRKLKESNRDKYAELLQYPTKETFYKRMGTASTGLETNFEFSNDEGETKRLIIPGGAVSIFCAPTSHGKSTMLRNLAIEMAKEQTKNPGQVLYFTFEESEEDLWAQLLNTYIGKDLHRPSKTHNNFKTIKEYFITREQKGEAEAEKVLSFMGDNKRTFLGHLDHFTENYLFNGRLNVINRNYDITELVAAIKYYCKAVAASGQKVKAIFVDYIQLLSLADRKKLSRAEELKEVCIELKDYSVESHLPIVLAAQLNRETKSPLQLFNQNISEASDIEKVANLIVCIWNSKFEAQDQTYYGTTKDGKKTKANEDANRLVAKHFYAGGAKKYKNDPDWKAAFEIDQKAGKLNKLYAKITKYRGESVGLDAVLDWNPNTGKIAENYTEAENTLFNPEEDEAAPF